MRDIMVIISGFFGKRYSKRQKNKFIKYMTKQFVSFGFKVENIVTKNKVGQKVTSLVFGDIESSETIYLTSLDTPSKIMFKNYVYYPFNKELEDANNKKNGKIGLAIVVFLIFIYFVFMFPLFKTVTKTLWKVVLWIITTVFLLVINLLMKGIANKNNFTRNTAAISLMYDIAKKRKSDCFIFLDQFSTTNMGLYEIENRIELKDKRIVILDCIGGNGEYGFSIGKGAERFAKLRTNLINDNIKEYRLKGDYDIYSRIFGSYMIIGSGTEENDNLISKNTRSKNDQIIDFKLMEKLENILLR